MVYCHVAILYYVGGILTEPVDQHTCLKECIIIHKPEAEETYLKGATFIIVYVCILRLCYHTPCAYRLP